MLTKNTHRGTVAPSGVDGIETRLDPADVLTATILIVDDTPENLSVLAALLRPTYRVLATHSGQRALEIAASDPKPDLILLDVMMAEMDGYAVLAHMKANPATKDIPVIFVTSLDNAEDEQRGLDLGAADYITKPLRPPIILARVRTQLELKRARDWMGGQNAFLKSELAQRVAEIELILSSVGEGIYGTNTNGVINFINPAAAAMLGYERGELLGRSAHAAIHHSRPDGSLFPVDDCPRHTALATGLAIRNEEDLIWRKDGSALPVQFSSMPMRRGGALLGAVVTFIDISERKQHEEQLLHQATHDELTGLPNRCLFQDRIRQAITSARRDGNRVAVLILDLDNFKTVNDSFGHAFGDALLVDVSRRLKDMLGEEDTLARLGGDEFGIVLSNLGQAGDAVHMAEMILRNFIVPCRVNNQDIIVSGSLGLSFFPEDAADGATLLRYADLAMYQAKQSGRGINVAFSESMDSRLHEDLRLHVRLKHALDIDGLVLHYQPQVDTETGAIVGSEALLRWRDDELGDVSPVRFIPVAEATGLILPLGDWVIETACRQIAMWSATGTPMKVSVNLSPHQLRDSKLAKKIKQALCVTGALPELLEIEITETAVMENLELAQKLLAELVDLGIGISLDDFGTGYSSLSSLKTLPITKLKIDQSFVKNLPGDGSDVSLVRTIIGLAKSLSLGLVAEGVETNEQRIFLQQSGCDTYQGWLFSKAVPAIEMGKMLCTEVGGELNCLALACD